MPRLSAARLTFGILALAAAAASAEEIAVNQSRPLFVLCSDLWRHYGMLVTYEDAPVDRNTETVAETRPNGVKVLSPGWRPITFRVPDGLMRRDSKSLAANAPAEESAAVTGFVRQYNESGNPGRFAVVRDGSYLHIVMTQRREGRRIRDIEPLTSTVVKLDATPKACYEIMTDVFAQLQAIRGVNMAWGAMPTNSMYHQCTVEKGPLTVRQVLAQVMEGVGANRITGEKTADYTWAIVYEPNWNKYFVSIEFVRDHEAHSTGQRQDAPLSPALPPPTGVERIRRVPTLINSAPQQK